MRESTRKEIVEAPGERVKELVKGLVEKLMLEERELYLAGHPTKGNGSYTRPLAVARTSTQHTLHLFIH